MSHLKDQWATLGSRDGSCGQTAYYKTILMLIPFFSVCAFSYSGLKFCPSVSFSAVWPPLYKRTCGHFISCNGKLLVNTIFFWPITRQPLSTSGHVDAVKTPRWSFGRWEKGDLKWLLNVVNVAVWVSDGSLVFQCFTNCHRAAGILSASKPSRGFTQATSSKRQLEEDPALTSEGRMGDWLEAVERRQ